MRDTFEGAAAFNSDISKWITSFVTSLYGTFNKAAAFNSDMSKWITSSVTGNAMSGTFMDAASFTGTGVDLWNINKVKDMDSIFKNANALNSCNKRKIADAWKSNAAFTAQTYDTDWAADKCACGGGETFSTSGGAPCTACAEASTCAAGVKTACTAAKNTACKVSTVLSLLVCV
jgi:hypothetical protein